MTARQRNRPVGTTAVVVGASIAGLCAARVLADRFVEVFVIDRDDLPDTARGRNQVPQGRHPHLLLPAGAELLDGWFPGLSDELVGAGAVELDLCADFHWYQDGGVWARPPSRLRSPALSRPLLERTIRRRLQTIGNVRLCPATAAVGIDTTPDGSRVIGAQLDDGSTLACDLLVDCTGRRAHTLEWLETLGVRPPPVSTVVVDTRYVTRIYRRTEVPARTWKAAAVVAEPAEKRLAMVMPVEGDRWYVTFGGLNGEIAPTDEDGFLAYAESLPSPVVADVIRCSEPLGDPAIHRFPANNRRHVERLRHFPLGWVLLGDAVASFDPIYGQGMTSAASQAAALAASVDRTGCIDRRFARRYFKAASRVASAPWSLAVGGDFVYSGTRGPKPFGTDLLNRYVRRLSLAAQHDDRVLVRLNEVISLVRRPEALFAPRLILGALRTGARVRMHRSGRALSQELNWARSVPTGERNRAQKPL